MLKGFGQYSVQATTSKDKTFVPVPYERTHNGFAETSSAIKSKRFTVTASDSMSSNFGSGNGYGLTGGSYATNSLTNTLSGFLPDENQNGALFRKLYKDLYAYDSVCGAAVDLKANLPFSDFTLTGVKDAKRLEKYLKSVENISIVKQLSCITVDYYAIGSFLGSLNFDESEGVFTSMLAHDLDDCELTWVPISGCDPIIDVKFNDNLKKLVASKDARLQQVRQMLPDYILQGIKKGKVELQPGATIFVPRRGLSSDFRGHSIFKRILAIHLVEKALVKGTIDRALKRQSPIIHLTCLSGNTLISTDKGIIKLKNIIEHEINGIQQCYNVNLSVKGIDGNYHKVDKFIYQGNKDTVKIITKSGRELICTPDHRILTSDNTFVEAKDLLGKKICVDCKWNLTEVINNENTLDEVINIVPYKKIPVYDLTMAKGEVPCFIANGIKVHNCGDETWLPTGEELTNLANLFRDADLDPTHAIVATRSGIQASTVNNPTDFWKWQDIFDFASKAKLNALGINDSFLSGDANYNAMDAALSVFMEDLKNTRKYMESEIFYDKMFPAIAVANDFKLEPNQYEVTSVLEKSNNIQRLKKGIFTNSRGEYIAVADGSNAVNFLQEDLSKYEIPTIHWHKQLNPVGDEAYLNMLNQMQEVGIPIPLSMWAAAGGLQLDDIIDELNDDKKIREKIGKITGVTPPYPGADQAGGGMGGGGFGGMGGGMDSGFGGMGGTDFGGGDGGFGSFSSTIPLSSKGFENNANVTGKVPLLARSFDDRLDPCEFDSDGNPHPVSARQKSIIRDKVNKLGAEVLSNMAEKNNFEQKESDRQVLEQAKTKFYPTYNRVNQNTINKISGLLKK